MIIRSIDFIGSAVNPSQYPNDEIPEIVLSGRSNVGKSSFINAMLNHNKIARVSQTPGKTRLINFFLINKEFYFVDIPGYGYANVNKDMQLAFQSMIETYLNQSSKLKLAVLLLDIRHTPTNDDLLMNSYYKSRGIPVMYVLTKADKLSNNQRLKAVKAIKTKLDFQVQDKWFLFSSVTKENRDIIWESIELAIFD
ncbi:MAG: ribosome biogenesis GTP-binding protein YihA/YsxC [Candidatus Izemoplasmatales bacterium]|jgi:GTP-binding protein|nr:ribosome biogenesis GTP-binding protein YihA/YsxC [Candidatus Izemoplasmatales bacterium]